MEKEIMKKAICLALLLLFIVDGCATLERRRVEKQAALDTTKTWFNYLDEMDYEKLWEISSDLLKIKNDKEDFLREVRGIRKPMGAVIDRDLQLNEVMPLILHYPDGNYRKVVYWSKYENKKFVREYFLLVKEGDRWAVVRYDFI
jgi:hypothetical protein